MTPWTVLEPARTVGRGVTTAVQYAALGDPSGYALAAAALGELPTLPTGAVLGAVVRMLLEEVHPGGLDGDDIREVLGRCLADTAGWLPSVSARILIAVLSSALGIHEAGVTYVEALAPATSPVPPEWVDPGVGPVLGDGGRSGRRCSDAPDDRRVRPARSPADRRPARDHRASVVVVPGRRLRGHRPLRTDGDALTVRGWGEHPCRRSWGGPGDRVRPSGMVLLLVRSGARRALT